MKRSKSQRVAARTETHQALSKTQEEINISQMYVKLETSNKDCKGKEIPPAELSNKFELHWQLSRTLNYEDYGMPIVVIWIYKYI
jgi:hypothetical protein